MKKKAVASGLVGLLAFGGAAAIATPIASAQIEGPSAERQERLDARSERLDQLVADGTLTQAQADEIEARFGERAERRAERRAETVAVITDVLGISADELQAAHQDGQTLADIAEANGVSSDALINTLVIEANARLDARLADGSIDADKAEEVRAGLVDRITARVNGERPERGDRAGRAGHRFGGADAPARFGPAAAGVGEA